MASSSGDSILLCEFFVDGVQIFKQIFCDLKTTKDLEIACMRRIKTANQSRAISVVAAGGTWQYKAFHKIFEEYVDIAEGDIPRGENGFPTNAKVSVYFTAGEPPDTEFEVSSVNKQFSRSTDSRFNRPNI